MNVTLLMLCPQRNRSAIWKEGITITCLELNSKTYISFIKNFIEFDLIFINLIIFFHHNCLISQQNWLYIKIKNLCHQQWQQSNENLACFIDIITFSFLNNWNIEMLFEKQYALKALYQCAKIFQSLQYNIRPLNYSLRTYCAFIRKFAATTKNLKTNYIFFIKPTCFY